MLNKNIYIVIKLNLSWEEVSVHEIIETVSKVLKNTTTEIIGSTINSIQQNILYTYLGSKWNEFKNKMVP